MTQPTTYRRPATPWLANTMTLIALLCSTWWSAQQRPTNETQLSQHPVSLATSQSGASDEVQPIGSAALTAGAVATDGLRRVAYSGAGADIKR